MNKIELSITYAITVCNELIEITKLVDFLLPKLHTEDEILIQYDSESSTKEVIEYLSVISALHSNIKVVSFPLNGDFASFKNNLKEYANGMFIFQIDADELPNGTFIDEIHTILDYNKDVDLFFVPRINTVDGITESHIKKWGWGITKLETQIGEKEMNMKSDEYKLLDKLNFIISEEPTDDTFVNIVKYYKPVINLPDYQSRLYRRTSEIQWENKVHEQIMGYNSLSALPNEEEYCLYHPKTIERQEKQNLKYSQMI